ncbi:serine hydrolase [Bergeyella sp. RCAD1439]|uniref:serine hydrolase n=1 Tax=Bergeyella anatis TaxID=3113737 RepID=UPI002E191969|nr:serine hydrolase [Bergeyella sp. RCAD1439]
MQKSLLILILALTTNLLFTQTDNYKTAIDNFQANYNAEKYDEIFNDFSPEMKQALPLGQIVEFLKGLKKQVGKIENKEFVAYKQGTYAMYKTKFERMILAVNISLDIENLINGLYIKQYEEPTQTNNAVNALNSYPKEIAEIIFGKTKNIPNNAQLSIALIQNGKTNYYGIIKINDTIKTIENHNKIFEIGSITKVFTSTVLASLVEDKKIKLADNINTFYPFTFKDDTKINFESLANHTSGLPRLPENLDPKDQNNPYEDYDKKAINEYLQNLMKLNSKTYAYSNLGAGLLGYTLGLSQKTTFQELLQKRIFDKYKMKNSFVNSQNLGNNLVKGLNNNGNTTSNWDFDVLFGGGGILSTTEDLAKFANAQFNLKNKELALTRKPTFDINENMKIGLGWHILKSENGKDLIWHNGGTGGYSSSMAVNIQEKTAIIILSNVADINENIDELCFELTNKTDKK